MEWREQAAVRLWAETRKRRGLLGVASEDDVRAGDEEQIKEAGNLVIASCIRDQWGDVCR